VRVSSAVDQSPSRLSFAERQTSLVVSVLAVGLFLLAFREIGEAVGAGGARAFDHAIYQAVRAQGSPQHSLATAWANIAAGDFSAMGSVSVLAFIVVMVCGLFLCLRRHAEAALLLVASGGGLALTNFLKDVFHQDRPPLSPEQLAGLNASFPSGHAMLSATVYLTLGALIAQFAGRRLIRLYILGVAILLTALIGLSRIYLGLHWTTDVLGGWCVGAAWALGWRAAVLGWRRLRSPSGDGIHRP
jgi:undecaprenyl-diphosphatase